MDIFSWAEQFPNADYYDMHTGRIYEVSAYTRAKKMGLPINFIRVTENGKEIGVVYEPEGYEYVPEE